MRNFANRNVDQADELFIHDYPGPGGHNGRDRQVSVVFIHIDN